uniref:Arm-DNA-bind_5 domain-containing protein n=1 Tax=Heterorhabditis bacteriophora TaxID=37862 RepID=A0A1I7WVT8_HETBA
MIRSTYKWTTYKQCISGSILRIRIYVDLKENVCAISLTGVYKKI